MHNDIHPRLHGPACCLIPLLLYFDMVSSCVSMALTIAAVGGKVIVNGTKNVG